MLLFDSWFKTLDSCVRNKYELLSEIKENDSPFKGIYVEFYEAMIERYNECINEVLAFVKERGGYSKLIKDANEVVITVALTTKDCSHRYTKLLLQGKDMSLLTPVSDLTLIFRGISFLNSESTGSLFLVMALTKKTLIVVLILLIQKIFQSLQQSQMIMKTI